jgi:hypothetical protein
VGSDRQKPRGGHDSFFLDADRHYATRRRHVLASAASVGIASLAGCAAVGGSPRPPIVPETRFDVPFFRLFDALDRRISRRSLRNYFHLVGRWRRSARIDTNRVRFFDARRPNLRVSTAEPAVRRKSGHDLVRRQVVFPIRPLVQLPVVVLQVNQTHGFSTSARSLLPSTRPLDAAWVS